MKLAQVRELLLQSLESELSAILVYESAIACALIPSLAGEWRKCLEETRGHVETLLTICERLDVDPETDSAGRAAVRHIGNALVHAMQMAMQNGDRATAQLIACECVVLAKTKDHIDWELIGKVAREGGSEIGAVLLDAYERTGNEEDCHFLHSRSWWRELWIESLGLPCALPPPLEEDDETCVAEPLRAGTGPAGEIRGS